MNTKLKITITLIVCLLTSGAIAIIVSGKEEMPALMELNVLALAESNDGSNKYYVSSQITCTHTIQAGQSLVVPGLNKPYPPREENWEYEYLITECRGSGNITCIPEDCTSSRNENYSVF